MGGGFKRAYGPGWYPSADARSMPEGTFPRADNLIWDDEGVVSLRKGLELLYGPLTDLDVHSLISAVLDGVQYRVSGQGAKLYSNGVEIDSGVSFDGSGDIAMDDYLGALFAARGETRKRFDGSNLFNWRPENPGDKPTTTAKDQVPVAIASFNQSESPAFSANEGTITGTYPTGEDGTPNGALEITPAATSRGTFTKEWTSDQDFLNIGGFKGSDTDLFDMLIWLSAPSNVKAVTVMFGLDDASDQFKDNFYQFTFNLESPPVTVITRRTAPTVIDVKDLDAVGKQIKNKVAEAGADVSTGQGDEGAVQETHEPPSTEDVLDRAGRGRDRGRVRRFDKATNPGWFHIAVARGQFLRSGGSERGWNNVRAFKIIYEATTGTSTARFDTARFVGGGDRALTGTFRILYKFVRQATDEVPFVSRSKPSEVSDEIALEAQGLKVHIPATVLAGKDPQVDRIWIYMTGGYLAEWYRVAVTGVTANDQSFNLFEFPKNPDGTISATDRSRLATLGLPVPGVQEGEQGFDPLSLSPTTWVVADEGVYSDAGSTEAGNGDGVHEWHDQSGNDFDWEQATGVSQPTLLTGVLNGFPVVYFDGSEYMETAAAILSDVINADAGTVFVVFRTNGSSDTTFGLNDHIWGAEAATVAACMYQLQIDANVPVAELDDTADIRALARVAVNTDDYHIATMRHNGSNLSCWVDDARDESATNTAAGNVGTLTANLRMGHGGGSGQFFDGYIAEILVFDTALSEADRKQVESYLADKYDLPLPYAKTAFYGQVPASGDLIVTVTENEIDALIRDERMDALEAGPPEDIVGIAHYQDRIFCLTSDGLIWISKRKDPAAFLKRHLIRAGSPSAEPLWIRAARTGVYAGTTDDIIAIVGDGTENLDDTVNLFPRELGVSHPPINEAAAVEGTSIIYCAADGWRTLDGDTSVPLSMEAVRLLYDGVTRYGVSAPNLANGRFRLAVGRGSRLVALVPEGNNETETSVLHRFYRGRWHRHTYTPSFRSIAEEEDGSLILGDDEGNIWKLDSGTQDNGSDIPVVLWTGVDEDGLPLNLKDLHELQVQLNTGGAAATIALHKDGSDSAALSGTASPTTLAMYMRSLLAAGSTRATQLRLTGSFSTFAIRGYLVGYRTRPQHRFVWDTGYVQIPRRGDYGWIREIRIKAKTSNNFQVRVYADDMLVTTKTVTAQIGQYYVYRVPVRRGTKGTTVRVHVSSGAGASITDVGLDLSWAEIRMRPSGNKSEKDFIRVHPSQVA